MITYLNQLSSYEFIAVNFYIVISNPVQLLPDFERGLRVYLCFDLIYNTDCLTKHAELNFINFSTYSARELFRVFFHIRQKSEHYCNFFSLNLLQSLFAQYLAKLTETFSVEV